MINPSGFCHCPEARSCIETVILSQRFFVRNLQEEFGEQSGAAALLLCCYLTLLYGSLMQTCHNAKTQDTRVFSLVVLMCQSVCTHSSAWEMEKRADPSDWMTGLVTWCKDGNQKATHEAQWEAWGWDACSDWCCPKQLKSWKRYVKFRKLHFWFWWMWIYNLFISSVYTRWDQVMDLSDHFHL